MLGSEVARALHARGIEFVAPSSQQLDLTDLESVSQIVAKQWGTPDWCINCAAYTAVDKAETEAQQAYELNALAPGYLATATQAIGCRLLHLSTDYVFDGRSQAPYATDAVTRPLGKYGESKLEGEFAVIRNQVNGVVVRTSWLFGANGPSFPRSILRAALAQKPLRVVADQVGNPTYAGHLASKLVELIMGSPFPGIYHATGPETMSWFEFAVRVLAAWSPPLDVSVDPITTADWPTPARRPQYSVLDTSEFDVAVGAMPPLEEALRDFCERLKEAYTDGP